MVPWRQEPTGLEKTSKKYFSSKTPFYCICCNHPEHFEIEHSTFQHTLFYSTVFNSITKLHRDAGSFFILFHLNSILLIECCSLFAACLLVFVLKNMTIDVKMLLIIVDFMKALWTENLLDLVEEAEQSRVEESAFDICCHLQIKDFKASKGLR